MSNKRLQKNATLKATLSLIALWVGIASSATAQQVFNSTTAFGGTQGVDGFYYMSYDPVEEVYSQLQHYTATSPTQGVWQKSQAVEFPQIKNDAQVPGVQDGPEDVVRSWQAPYSGKVQIETPLGLIRWAFSGAGGDGVRISIRRNRFEIFSELMPSTVAGIPFAPLTIPINRGDRLNFHVDRYGTGFGDWVDFRPVITLVPGPGYTDIDTSNSVTQFGQSTGPWHYLAVPQGQGGQFQPALPGPYIPMTWQAQSPARWEWVSGTTTSAARVYLTRQTPESTHDSVRAWIAPESGDVHLSTIVPIAMSSGQPTSTDGAIVQIHHNDRLVWSKTLAPTDTLGEMVKRRLQVNKDDSITFRVSAGPSQNATGDVVNLQVELKLAPAEDSGVAFSGASPSSWSYSVRDRATGVTTPMTFNAAQSEWQFTTPSLKVARIGADRQNAVAGFDTVRGWTAPVDCVVHLDTRGYVRQLAPALSGEDGLDIAVLRGTDVVLQERVGPADQVGVPVNARIPMRQGEKLEVVVGDGMTGNDAGDEVGLSFRLVRHVNGTPPRNQGQTVEMFGSGTPPEITLNQPLTITGGKLKVFGSINLDPGAFLDLRDCVLEFQNTKQREFNLNWRGGRLATTNVVCGGNLSSANIIYHSNFWLEHGEWYCTDTRLRYHYGVLPGTLGLSPNTSGSFRGTRVSRGADCGELILSGPGDSKLVDSVFVVNLRASVPESGASTNSYDLPTTETILNRTFGGSNVPGALYTLTVSNTLVPTWLFLTERIRATGIPMQINFNPLTPASVVPNIHGYDLQGGYGLPIFPATDETRTVGVGNLEQKFHLSDVRYWGAYFSGHKSNVIMLGTSTGVVPSYDHSQIVELQVYDGKAQYRGSGLSQRDAHSMATTIECGHWGASSPTVDVVMKNVDIGVDGLRGQITVRPGSRLVLEDCKIRNVDLKNDNGTVIVARGSLTNVDFPSTAYSVNNNHYEPVYRWEFAGSREGWQNWDKNVPPYHTQGFPEPWVSVGSTLRLNYPAIPSGGWTPPGFDPSAGQPHFQPRIIAPFEPLLGMNLKHCYLVLRVNPHVAATTQPIRLLVSAKDADQGWASWSKYEREVEIAATPGWVTYVWDLNAGTGAAHSRLSPVLGVQPGWQPYSGRTDYLGIQFGTYAQNGTLNAPDWLELDYVVITDDFTPY